MALPMAVQRLVRQLLIAASSFPWHRLAVKPVEQNRQKPLSRKGAVLSGGADWQWVRSDGVAVLETRYTLQTDDGVLIYVQK